MTDEERERAVTTLAGGVFILAVALTLALAVLIRALGG
jgi:hypothetical protein